MVVAENREYNETWSGIHQTWQPLEQQKWVASAWLVSVSYPDIMSLLCWLGWTSGLRGMATQRHIATYRALAKCLFEAGALDSVHRLCREFGTTSTPTVVPDGGAVFVHSTKHPFYATMCCVHCFMLKSKKKSVYIYNYIYILDSLPEWIFGILGP